jgi:hypothetical protein
LAAVQLHTLCIIDNAPFLASMLPEGGRNQRRLFAEPQSERELITANGFKNLVVAKTQL